MMQLKIFFGFILAYTQSSSSESKTTDETNKINAIFIMADDLGYGDLGACGQQQIKTPHINQMAREGLQFMQCYAGSPVCAPSRSVLMAGQHTGHTTVRGNMSQLAETETNPQGRAPLHDADTSLRSIEFINRYCGYLRDTLSAVLVKDITFLKLNF